MCACCTCHALNVLSIQRIALDVPNVKDLHVPLNNCFIICAKVTSDCEMLHYLY
jgi:hypothetical protein